MLEKLTKEVPAITKFGISFGDRRKNVSDVGLEKFKVLYKYVFKNSSDKKYKDMLRCVSSNLKGKCIKFSNGLKNI